MSNTPAAPPVELHSVMYHAAVDYAAQKYLDWERMAYDVRETVTEDWRRRFWRLWFRARWFEHVLGDACWMEMGLDNFAILREARLRNPVLFGCVVDRLIVGWENLHIIPWALDWGLDLDLVIELLKKVNINNVRVNNRSIEEIWEPLLH